FGVTHAVSSPASLITANDCAANASFSSITSISDSFNPASFNAFGIANTGPNPIYSGLYPAVANEKKRVRGLMPSCFTRSPDITTAAAAPSDICDELPAVTVPFTWNAALSESNASSDVSARGPSSTLKTISCLFGFDPFGVVKLTGTGTISSSNRNPLIAAIAL